MFDASQQATLWVVDKYGRPGSNPGAAQEPKLDWPPSPQHLTSNPMRGTFGEPDVQTMKVAQNGGMATGHGTNGNPVRQGPQAKLITYEGNTDWESFIIPFERMANRYGWTERDQFNWLFGFIVPTSTKIYLHGDRKGRHSL